MNNKKDKLINDINKTTTLNNDKIEKLLVKYKTQLTNANTHRKLTFATNTLYDIETIRRNNHFLNNLIEQIDENFDLSQVVFKLKKMKSSVILNDCELDNEIHIKCTIYDKLLSPAELKILKDWNVETPDEYIGLINTIIIFISVVDDYKPTENMEVRKKELDFKTGYGFFPTPKTVIDRMIALVGGISESDFVLEPSAGTGNILMEIDKHTKNHVSIEYNVKRYEFLKECGYNTICYDFLRWESDDKFDIILMNPPFEKGQDIEHVTKALKHLKSDNQYGVLCSVMSGNFHNKNDKKHKLFMELISEYDYQIEQLDDKSFKESNTNVNCCLLTIF